MLSIPSSQRADASAGTLASDASGAHGVMIGSMC